MKVFAIHLIFLIVLVGAVAERVQAAGSLQIIHNAPQTDTVDVYVDDARIGDDLSFLTATPFIATAEGVRKVDIVAGADSDNSNPIVTDQVTIDNGVNYLLQLIGPIGQLEILVRADVRLQSNSGDPEFFFSHGSPDLGAVDVRELDSAGIVIGLLANNLGFKENGSYLTISPELHRIQVTNSAGSTEFGVFPFDLTPFNGKTLVLLLSGLLANESVKLVGFDVEGNTICATSDVDCKFVDLMNEIQRLRLRVEELEAIQPGDHTHSYRTGRFPWHNRVEATTGPAQNND